MLNKFYQQIASSLQRIKNNGLFKEEYIIETPQGSFVKINNKQNVINFCSNNYLGLANHNSLVVAAKRGIDNYGFGVASVRFICGTQIKHKTLENKLSKFLMMEDTILYSSCFDANIGLFESLFGPEDAIISDSLNHASIIDGIRLCKAKRFIFINNRMDSLEKKLDEAKLSNSRYIAIVVDGVSSMDGIIANLQGICDLAYKYQALVIVDDSHAVGILGKNGIGTHEYCNVIGKVDIITGTLGKALGGASGGYVSAKKNVIEWLRQNSRPYLFSNSLSPAIVSASLKAIEIIEERSDLREKLWYNSYLFRDKLLTAGFKLIGADHAIIPIILGDAKLAKEFANELLKEGIYVIGFSYPVVPKNLARIRIQVSAMHTKDQIIQSVNIFIKIAKRLNIIK